jgi:hypothetical protein
VRYILNSSEDFQVFLEKSRESFQEILFPKHSRKVRKTLASFLTLSQAFFLEVSQDFVGRYAEFYYKHPDPHFSIANSNFVEPLKN